MQKLFLNMQKNKSSEKYQSLDFDSTKAAKQIPNQNVHTSQNQQNSKTKAHRTRNRRKKQKIKR